MVKREKGSTNTTLVVNQTTSICSLNRSTCPRSLNWITTEELTTISKKPTPMISESEVRTSPLRVECLTSTQGTIMQVPLTANYLCNMATRAGKPL